MLWKTYFEDFYEWLIFRIDFEKTNYDWYIKDHPYYLILNMQPHYKGLTSYQKNRKI